MIGQSFAPLGDQNDPTRPQGQQEGVNPVQEAIKVLTLRLPRALGASSPAPRELLTGLGGAGTPMGTGNPLGEILKKLLTGMLPPELGAPSAPMGGGPVPSAPSAPMPQAPQAPTQPAPTSFKPKVEYIPTDDLYSPPDTEIKPPLPAGQGRRVYSQ
jgi:hypothetical protein